MDEQEETGMEDGIARIKLDNDVPATNETVPPPADSFRDVTKEFFEESKKLNIGELIRDPYFTLLEAVSGLEIMDPKMDSGMLEPEYELFDALQPRLPEEILGIMDQLLCHEMAWHMGSAPSQTLFTSLYVDKLLSSSSSSSSPKTLDEVSFAGPGGQGTADTEECELLEKVLKPYCLALIKCCFFVNEQIAREHIYEEEDFVTQTYGVVLYDTIDVKEFIALLKSAQSWLESRSSGAYSPEIIKALNSRMVLRLEFLQALSRDVESWQERSTSEWDTCLLCLDDIEKTHSLEKPVPGTFSTSVQRKLASQVPPRPMVEIPFEEAIVTLRKLCTEGKEILRILDYDGATNIINFFLHFMARRPSPSAYIRSLIQSLFFKDMKVLGRLSIKQILYDDLRELCNPVEVLLDPTNDSVEAPQDPRFEIVKRMNWFVERAGRSYMELYRNICQNRSRLRRNLCHSILDWDSLQIEAEETDFELHAFTKQDPRSGGNGNGNGNDPPHSFPLSSWVYHYKIRQMEWIILLGFELEVFQPHEFAGMYWYLQHYNRKRIGHLEQIRGFVAARNVCDEQAEINQQKTMSLLNYSLLEASAMQELSGAMITVYSALGRLDLLGKPTQPYGSDLLRYELRMKPFLSIGSPEIAPFEIFQTLVDDPRVEILELLSIASEYVTEARKEYDSLSKLDSTSARSVLCEDGYRMNLREIIRSCVGLAVAIAVLSKAIKAGTVSKTELEVEIDRERYHPFFPVPRVVVRRGT